MNWVAGPATILVCAGFILSLVQRTRSGQGLVPYTTGMGFETNPVQVLATIAFLAVVSLLVGVVILARKSVPRLHTPAPGAAWPFAHQIIRAVLINFFLFAFVALLLGGDAVNGRMDGGRYFLFDRGALTEVSREVWYYSRMHTYLMFASFPIALLAMLYSRRAGGARIDRFLIAFVAGGMAALVLCGALKGAPGPASWHSALVGLLAGLTTGVAVLLFLRNEKHHAASENESRRTGG